MPLDPDPNPNPNPGSQNVADPLDPGLKLKHCLKSLLRIRSARKTYQNFEQSSLSLPFLSTFYVYRSIFIKSKFFFWSYVNFYWKYINFLWHWFKNLSVQETQSTDLCEINIYHNLSWLVFSLYRTPTPPSEFVYPWDKFVYKINTIPSPYWWI